jgi:hypothetical protein
MASGVEGRAASMKSILLALFFGVLLLAIATVSFNRIQAENKARLLLWVFAVLLAVLVLAHLCTPAGLGFLPYGMVMPIWWVDLGFSVFLFASGFFGGVLQLYNLADRGLSLRILIDVLEAPGGSLTLDDVMTDYGGGRGIAWMYDKRISGMAATGLVRLDDSDVVLTDRGRRVAAIFARLQDFVRVRGDDQ